MSRVDAAERALFGLFYLPLYYVLLYPVVFFVSVFLTAINILLTFIIGRDPGFKSDLTAGSWETISQPVTWFFSGDQSDKPGWVP